MKSHPEWNMTPRVHISLRSLTCCINDTKEADWSLVSVHSPWLHPLKHSYQVTSFQERKTSFHLSDDPQIHLPKLCSAELTRPDPPGVQAEHVQELPPIEETNAANQGQEASAFQYGKCSAESWDFLGEIKTTVQAKPPNQLACCKADVAKNKMSAVKWYWVCSSDCQHQSISQFQILPFL